MFKSDMRSKTKAIVLAATLAVLPLTGQAAGLGRITVLSPLGQPLKAELELTATREELSSLSARIAPAEAFRQMGIEFAPVAATIRFILDKRPDGQPFLLAISDRPVNEPFLDILVELNWAAGRMVREYTFLLDPPEILRVEAAPAAVVAPTVKAEPVPATAAPVVPAPAMPEMRATAPVDEKLLPKEAEEIKPAEKPAAEGEAVAVRTVKRGDTLGRIAAEIKPAGVSLDQMLVALFNRNKDVFDGANMNRVRAGKILNLPDAEAARGIEAGEARRIIVAQAADFDAYRRKLAAVAAVAKPAKEEAPRQAVAGKITPKVEDKAPAPGKDKLEVSRTEPTKGARDAGRIAALEEDIVARDKALKEAGSRIAELQKNLGDLEKLAELKSQAGADLQKQAQAAKPVPEAKPEPAPAAEKTPEKSAAEAVAKPPAGEALPAEAKPAPKKPATARKPMPPPPPAPGFIEENPTLAFGGGGVLLLLLGYLGFKAWRRKHGGADMEATSRITESELTAGSVFGATGGQNVDTGAAMPTDFSQTGATAIDADEGVDPVAEADVYMAYGRDVQAEEILIDALKSDPTRYAIHLKLLEIYAARKSLKQFETLASDLYGQTGGTGPDWEKASAMGRNLDPGNPLYGGSRQAMAAGAAPAGSFDATIVVAPPEIEKVQETVSMPGELARIAAAAEAAPAAPPQEEAPVALDFDLDLGGAPAQTAPEAPPQAVDEVASLDFDLDLGTSSEPAEAAPAPAAEPPSLDIDFDFDLGEPVAAPAPSADGEEAAAAMPLDLSAISLDLGEPADVQPSGEAQPEIRMEPEIGEPILEIDAVEAPEPLAAEPESPAADNPEVATKIELAQAYEEMGDNEGARELLQEVLSEGSPAQQEIARAKLAQLEA